MLSYPQALRRIRALEGAIKVHRNATVARLRLLSEHGSGEMLPADRHLYAVLDEERNARAVPDG